MVYLSRHETQGIAAQQMMASGVPLFVWDEGGLWQDPKYAPHQVRVRTGLLDAVLGRSAAASSSADGQRPRAPAFDAFWQGVEAGTFAPREMILQRLKLEDRARAYLKLADKYA